ncbi:MAG: acyl-CoA desaturase [Kangiellaceae bacterium]|nr:acyl-CoA desaturase [Kangiellaceae bacterium]
MKSKFSQNVRHANSYQQANEKQVQHYSNERILEHKGSDAISGAISLSTTKSFWLLPMTSLSIIGGYLTFSFTTLSVFLLFTAITLCFGHSLGMHRRLIHKSYDCPKWLEYFFVHLGCLVGIAGPASMMHTHDMRDWAQRQPKCHDYFGHRQVFWKDAYWQVLCDIKLVNPPKFQPEKSFSQDKIYQWMEKYWMLQQLPWAILLFVLGGISWVIWGICVRVVVSTLGHWLIGYFAHNHGSRKWYVEGASVQGYNIKFAGLITMGECWHNNHHAYPGSARLGLESNQSDPGWWILVALKKFGLVWNVVLPNDLPERPELHNFQTSKQDK